MRAEPSVPANQPLESAMPSILGHTMAGLTLSAVFTGARPPRRVWMLATACAVAPDLDWFTFFVLPDGNVFGHRGVCHSLLFAALITIAAMLFGFRSRLRSPRLWCCMGAATLSHGLLDACTFGGTGVGFLLPFSDLRYVCRWQPLFVSPIPLNGRLLEWFLFSLGTELVGIGLPCLLVWTFLLQRRRWSAARAEAPESGRDPE